MSAVRAAPRVTVSCNNNTDGRGEWEGRGGEGRGGSSKRKEKKEEGGWLEREATRKEQGGAAARAYTLLFFSIVANYPLCHPPSAEPS